MTQSMMSILPKLIYGGKRSHTEHYDDQLFLNYDVTFCGMHKLGRMREYYLF